MISTSDGLTETRFPMRIYYLMRKYNIKSNFVISFQPLDVPVVPGITGRVTFDAIEMCEVNKKTPSGFILQDELFKIPIGYVLSEVI